MVSSAQVFELAAPVVATYPISAFNWRGEMQDWLSTMSDSTVTGAILWTLAALVGLALILAAIKFVRGSRQGTYVAGGRNRRPRLAVIDAAPVDTQRRLVLIRRDHVEHLVLIGGQSDLVIERGIPIAPQPQPVPQPDHEALAGQRNIRARRAMTETATTGESRKPADHGSEETVRNAGLAGMAAAGAVAAAPAVSQQPSAPSQETNASRTGLQAEPAPVSAREFYEEQAAQLREKKAQPEPATHSDDAHLAEEATQPTYAAERPQDIR